MGQLGPYLAMVEFFVGLGYWSGGLRWEVVVPSDDMIKCRSALLPFPCMLLLCMEASARVLKEVFQFVVRHPNVFIERLSIIPAASLVCTIQNPAGTKSNV